MNRQETIADTANVIEIDIVDDEPQVVPVIMTTVGAPRVDNRILPEPSAGLIQSLFTSFKEMRKERSLILPIKKISNIGVEVSIRKQTKAKYIFSIEPTDFSVLDDNALYVAIYDNNNSEIVMEEDKFIERVVHSILLSLKKIKIDKLNGQLTIDEPSRKGKKIDDMWAEFCQEYKDDEHLEMSIKECCVCFTMTRTTTNCGHTVCLECISKLKPVEVVAEENVMRNVKCIGCPMCRQRIVSIL